MATTSEAGGTERPRLSVAICTRGRPAHLQRAIAPVLAQEGEHLVEIFVVNHGIDPIPVDVASDPRLRIVEIGFQPTGAARAAALTAAQGDYLAFCDDLDAWEPRHLTTLLAEIERFPRTALVHAAATWIDTAGEPTATPVIDRWPGAAQTPLLYASGVLHRVDAARAVGGYDAYLNAFAEWDLALRLSDWWDIRHVPAVVVRHEADSERDELTPLLVEDRQRVVRHAFARRIRFPHHRAARPARQTPRQFDPATWQDGRRELDLASVWAGRHSYASVNKGLLPALARQGISLFLQPTSTIPSELAMFGRSDGDRRRMLFFYEVGNRPKDQGIEPLIQYTMYELDHIPLVHVEEINNYVSLLLLPCRQNRLAFLEAGVTAPVKVLHHGIDSSAFPVLARGDRSFVTFGTFGQQNERKGVDVLLRAFRDEFARGEAVRLILNATMTDAWLQDADPRVEIRSGFLDHAGLLAYLAELDVFVLPSRGEGFGLCGLEAMATGLPVIATNWSGPADYLDPADSFSLEYQLTEMAGREFGSGRLFGRWAEPSYEHLRALLRHLYEHRDDGRAAGQRAAARIHAHWTWDRAARQLAGDLDLLARGVSPATSDDAGDP